MLSNIIDSLGIAVISVLETTNMFTGVLLLNNFKVILLASAASFIGITLINSKYIILDLHKIIEDMKEEYDILEYRFEREFESNECELKRLNNELNDKRLRKLSARGKLTLVCRGIDILYFTSKQDMSKQDVSNYSMKNSYEFLKREIMILNKLKTELGL